MSIDSTIHLISAIRHRILSIPFQTAFDCVAKGVDGSAMTIPLHGQEAMFILPYSDRVMVTYALAFDEDSDAVLAKVFLQEFFDTRQKHTVTNAPTVIYGKDLPAEMAPHIPEATKTSCSFISFGRRCPIELDLMLLVLLPSHVTAEKRDRAASLVINFRAYLHLHLKNTKAYLHNRMRSKVADFLKVLNRAKVQYNN